MFNPCCQAYIIVVCQARRGLAILIQGEMFMGLDNFMGLYGTWFYWLLGMERALLCLAWWVAVSSPDLAGRTQEPWFPLKLQLMVNADGRPRDLLFPCSETAAALGNRFACCLSLSLPLVVGKNCKGNSMESEPPCTAFHLILFPRDSCIFVKVTLVKKSICRGGQDPLRMQN